MAGIRKREGGERGEGGRGSKGSEARLEEGKSWRLLLRLDFPVPSPQPRGSAAPGPALPQGPAPGAPLLPAGTAWGWRGETGGGRSPGQPVPVPVPVPGRVSPPHGSLRTLSVTQAPTGTAARGPGGTPMLRRWWPVAVCPLPVASLRAAQGHPTAPRPPELRAWGHRRGARLGGTDSASILYSIQSCFLSGADICPGIKKDEKKKKVGEQRQSSSSVSGCGKILVF